MKKIKVVNNMVIDFDKKTAEYSVFTKDEYSYGEGCRYSEYDGITKIEEAEEMARFHGKN
jgi:hypothetical protein